MFISWAKLFQIVEQETCLRIFLAFQPHVIGAFGHKKSAFGKWRSVFYWLPVNSNPSYDLEFIGSSTHGKTKSYFRWAGIERNKRYIFSRYFTACSSIFCRHNMQEDGEDGFTTELISQAKQSRSEKKARKALCKLGKPTPAFTELHCSVLLLVKSMKSCSVSTPVNIVKLSVRSFALYVKVDNF